MLQEIDRLGGVESIPTMVNRAKVGGGAQASAGGAQRGWWSGCGRLRRRCALR